MLRFSAGKNNTLPQMIYVADRAAFTMAEQPIVLLVGEQASREFCHNSLRGLNTEYVLLSADSTDMFSLERAKQACIVLFFGEDIDAHATLKKYGIADIQRVDTQEVTAIPENNKTSHPGNFFYIVGPERTALSPINRVSKPTPHVVTESKSAYIMNTILKRLIGFNKPEKEVQKVPTQERRSR